MDKIFIIKVKNFNSDLTDVLCAYDNENSAIEHIYSYKKIYAEDLNAEIWYDNIFLKGEFRLN